MVSSATKLSKQTVERKRFLKDPHRFATDLLNPPTTGKPTFSKSDADSFFQKTYSDSKRDFVYTPPPMKRPDFPKHVFNSSPPSFKELSDICWKKSNGSAPGFNGNSFLIYKKCPQTRRILYNLFCRIWKERVIPISWRVGRLRLIPKTDDADYSRIDETYFYFEF